MYIYIACFMWHTVSFRPDAAFPGETIVSLMAEAAASLVEAIAGWFIVENSSYKWMISRLKPP